MGSCNVAAGVGGENTVQYSIVQYSTGSCNAAAGVGGEAGGRIFTAEVLPSPSLEHNFLLLHCHGDGEAGSWQPQ